MESKAKLGGAGLIIENDNVMGTPLKKPAVGYVHGSSPKLPGSNDEAILSTSPLQVKGK